MPAEGRLGFVVALVVLLLAIVLGFIGELKPLLAVLFALLALARLT